MASAEVVLAVSKLPVPSDHGLNVSARYHPRFTKSVSPKGNVRSGGRTRRNDSTLGPVGETQKLASLLGRQRRIPDAHRVFATSDTCVDRGAFSCADSRRGSQTLADEPLLIAVMAGVRSLPRFERYIGIDYSGAGATSRSLLASGAPRRSTSWSTCGKRRGATSPGS